MKVSNFHAYVILHDQGLYAILTLTANVDEAIYPEM